MTDQELLKLAQRVCTPKQLEALELAARGYGNRRIGRILGISPQAAAARIDNAHRRLKPHLEEAA